MKPRFKALETTTERKSKDSNGKTFVDQEKLFGSYVFNRSVMRKMLPKAVYANLVNAIERREKIKDEYADAIAFAMKDWAISHGATHYTHMFQPLTGTSAEKHDSFIDWLSTDSIIQKFSGKDLIQGEPDASSFPSGGLRSTYEARGYTGWDPLSPAFLWKGGDGMTLCIPSIYFSWTGEVLDYKIPLLRSDSKLNDAVLRMLQLTGISANNVYTTLGLEQEYFVIDRALRNLRPDLVLGGRTVYGAPSPKGQELQDHYFGSVKDRILNYMQDFEEAALKLGIPVKTRHNEVAPAQHEVAPVFEKASVAIDHNLLLMELMRQIAVKHNLCCLLHEKPFQGLNGSGKHSNWSLMTDTGINLLDPSDTPENNVHFLILLTAILAAVHDHAGLLRAVIGSAANDYRLGGHEAPPAIISVYLGQELESVLDSICDSSLPQRSKGKQKYALGIPLIPDLSMDNTDRNRTSPFAFTGNKFEFRAVGSSANPSFPATVLNATITESLNRILNEIEAHLKNENDREKMVMTTILPVLKKELMRTRGIRFHGDGYSDSWVKEAEKRNFHNYAKSINAFEHMINPKTIACFEGILTKEELQSRYEIMAESYFNANQIEINLMIDIFQTQILPAALKHQKEVAESILRYEQVVGKEKNSLKKKHLKAFSDGIENALNAFQKLQAAYKKIDKISSIYKKGQTIATEILPLCEQLREYVDLLETQIDDELWPLPKYRELLFII